jgi:hypothetical protein
MTPALLGRKPRAQEEADMNEANHNPTHNPAHHPFATQGEFQQWWLDCVEKSGQLLQAFDPDFSVVDLGGRRTDAALRAFLRRGGRIELAMLPCAPFCGAADESNWPCTPASTSSAMHPASSSCCATTGTRSAAAAPPRPCGS